MIGFNKELEKTQILSGILTPAPDDGELNALNNAKSREQLLGTGPDKGSLEREKVLTSRVNQQSSLTRLKTESPAPIVMNFNN